MIVQLNERTHVMVFQFLLSGFLAFIAWSIALPQERLEKGKEETVLDRVVRIEKELILDIPDLSRWCDRLDLTKSRVNIGDCELYVEEEGEGTPVVLLHGGPGGTHHSFHPEFSRAKKFARIIYFDQRGCGLSDYEKGEGYTVGQAVDDLENLHDALKIGKWVVLGWSYGGLLAQCYTIKYPESVAGLVLMTAKPALRDTLQSTRQYDYLSEEEKSKIRELQFMYFTSQLSLEQLVYNAQLNGDWKRQHYYKPSREEMARAALYEWKHDNGFNSIVSRDARKINLKGAFENCPVPTLILEGKWDLTWNSDKPAKLYRNHPGSQLVVFSESGHSPFKDEPERFFNVLEEFIGQLPDVRDSESARWKEYLVKWKEER